MDGGAEGSGWPQEGWGKALGGVCRESTQQRWAWAEGKLLTKEQAPGWSDRGCASLAPKTWRQHLKDANISNKKPDFQCLMKIQWFWQWCVHIPTWPQSAGLSNS